MSHPFFDFSMTHCELIKTKTQDKFKKYIDIYLIFCNKSALFSPLGLLQKIYDLVSGIRRAADVLLGSRLEGGGNCLPPPISKTLLFCCKTKDAGFLCLTAWPSIVVTRLSLLEFLDLFHGIELMQHIPLTPHMQHGKLTLRSLQTAHADLPWFGPLQPFMLS